ncbi:hypothetical protein [Streptomyces iakyrus]|uniref:hypothetical protein n=1 Tax=Streptomyces iakyrus TaxID=68219 RepID=UPI003D8CDA3E
MTKSIDLNMSRPFSDERRGNLMRSSLATRKRRIATFAAVALTSATLSTSLAAPSQAAANATIQLRCQDERKTFTAHATLNGSGAPTAKYDVVISVMDHIDDTRAPKVRLFSANKDGSVTHYRWRTGDQGRSIQTYWETTLQQPKGLRAIFIEGTVNSSDAANFQCTDYGPK